MVSTIVMHTDGGDGSGTKGGTRVLGALLVLDGLTQRARAHPVAQYPLFNVRAASKQRLSLAPWIRQRWYDSFDWDHDAAVEFLRVTAPSQAQRQRAP